MHLVNFEILKDKVLTSFDITDKHEIKIKTNKNEKFRMLHLATCCEDVYLEDVSGDLNDILNSPLVLVEEVINTPPISYYDKNPGINTETFSFYKLGTNKGSVTLRRYGTSNGYYSETVELYKVGE